jgi:hypothetical protein
MGGERGLGERKRFGRMADEKQQARQIVARAIGVWMLRAERLLPYRQRALEKRKCPRKIALGPEQ